MYCIKCGVELSDGEEKCPLCKTVICHPDLPAGETAREASAPFPPGPHHAQSTVSHKGILFILTFWFAIPIIILFLCDYNFNGGVTWSGFAMGALAFCYAVIVLPIWFHRPNPVVFVPTSFAAAALYLLYISFATNGHWFMNFALWVILGAAVISTAVVALVKYVRRGYLYIAGGALIAAGGYSVLIEYLVDSAFGFGGGITWSLYPLTSGFLLGLMLILIAVVPVLRESLHKRFFIQSIAAVCANPIPPYGENEKHEMKIIYYDITGQENAMAFIVANAKPVPAGTTIYSMSVTEKNGTYKMYADKFDLKLIFNDDLPTVDFYAVPQVDIFATDSLGGLFGTVGQITDISDRAPICYIDKSKACYFLADSLKEFLQLLESGCDWSAKMVRNSDVTLYKSKADAEQNLEFLVIPEFPEIQTNSD